MAKKVTDAEIKHGIECTLDLFKGAAGKKRWTTHLWGRDASGAGVNPASKKACAWCLEGGIIKCTDGPRTNDYTAPRRIGQAVFDFLSEVSGRHTSLHRINDQEGYDAVMKLLRDGKKAINKRIAQAGK